MTASRRDTVRLPLFEEKRKGLHRSRSGVAADISGGRLASECVAEPGAATMTSDDASSYRKNGGRSVGDRLNHR
jgi:hypothetical protein